MMIFGAGFVIVQLVFVLLYWRAYALRGVLNLNSYETSITCREIRAFLILAGIGLASIAIALLGGEETVSWAGLVYMLIWPLLNLNRYLMARRRRKSASLT
jgi:hypothetical protein